MRITGYHTLILSLATVFAVLPATKTQANLTLAVFISAITDGVTSGEFSGSLNGRPLQVAVDIAVEAVNNHPEILNGYDLQAVYVDSQCSAGPSVRGFIGQVFDPSERIMIIGSDCSVSTEPVAELAPFWNLAQISPLSTSPALSDNDMYRNFLRMVSSDSVVAQGVVSLMERYNWTRVAVISQQESLFTSTFEELRSLVNANNFTSLLTNPNEINFNTGDNPKPFVNSLYNSPTRIIFLNVYPSYAIEILCEAYSLRMTYDNGYVWLLYAWYPDEWWTTPTARNNAYTPTICTREMIEDMLDRHISIDHFPFVEDGDRDINTAVGMTHNEFEDILTTRLRNQYPNASTALIPQAQFYFDAILTAALALNVTKDLYNLSTFTYATDDQQSISIPRHIFDTARALNFIGMSGEIRMDSVGDRIPNLRFFQYRKNQSTGKLTTLLIGNKSFFETDVIIFSGSVPQDELNVYVSLPLFVIYTVLSCAGIILAVACAIFNLIYRNRKMVKLSSPYLNMLIILGVILFYIDIILFGVDEGTATTCTVNGLCMVRVWIAAIAFSLTFGTIFIKTWRVYYIFFASNRHRKGKKTVIQDWVLFLVVVLLIVVDVVLLVIVTAIPDTRLQLTRREVIPNPQSPDLPQIIGVCTAAESLVWIIILLIWKGILLVTGLFLAFEIRNVKIKQLNDSKLIGISVAGIAILSIAATVIGLLLANFVDVFYAIIGLTIMSGNTFLLCVLFIPKFYGLWKDPEGLRVLGTSTLHVTTSVPMGEAEETITNLNQKVEQLKRQLESLKNNQTEGAIYIQNQSNDAVTIVNTKTNSEQ